MKKSLGTILVWGLLLGIVAVYLLNLTAPQPELTSVSSERALEMIRARHVHNFHWEESQIILWDDYNKPWVVKDDLTTVQAALAEGNIPLWNPSEDSRKNSSAWLTLLLLVALLAFFIWMLKRGGGTSYKTILELRKSKARQIQAKDQAFFADVGGNREAISLFEDIVSFLKNPKAWSSAGARVPRGVLIVGPPGVGKTLLARAVAGEAKASFHYVSASEFVELFVGVGAARMRDTFEQAAKSLPAIIFIDELDAVGRRRGSTVGTMHEEREHTLNQLLVQLDGLERRGQLVVIAATNRPDILDPALLRSGRFDTMLKLKPPTAPERLEILRIHTKNKNLGPDVNLEALADKAESFTGADLENWANQAALLAVRHHRQKEANGETRVVISAADFDRAWQDMTSSNRQFDRLDSILIDSVSQFSEPSGSARIRVVLRDGQSALGDVVWMNATHIKLALPEGSSIVFAKDAIQSLAPVEGTEAVRREDLRPDRWSERKLEIG